MIEHNVGIDPVRAGTPASPSQVRFLGRGSTTRLVERAVLPCLYGHLVVGALVLPLLGLIPGRAVSAEQYEHRRVAHHALEAVLKECQGRQTQSLLCISPDSSGCIPASLIGGNTFEELCAAFSDDDISPSRFQKRGFTVLQQLETLHKATVEAALQEYESSSPSNDGAFLRRLDMIQQPKQNVIVNYLLYHLVALNCARLAGQEEQDVKGALRCALITEARAQSYLVDAFCAGHLLAPVEDFFSSIHRTNTRKAHDFYNVEGVYVINSRYEVWQEFGDKLLEWYAPSYRHVVDASCTSLRELFLTYFTSLNPDAIPFSLQKWAHTLSTNSPPSELVNSWLTVQEGRAYYEVTKMPTLLELPMAVSAVWSEKTDRLDEHGIHQRKQYPQMREDGYHDPDLEGVDVEFLYAHNALPEWMRFKPTIPPGILVKQDTSIASVRYVQERRLLPSYIGLLLQVGASKNVADGSNGWTVALGYGMTDNILFLGNISGSLALMQPSTSDGRLLISPTAGLSVMPPSLPLGLSGVRFSLGYVWAFGETRMHGWTDAVGLETGTYPLWFTYAGISLRMMYQRVHLQPRIHNVLLEFVVQ